MSAGDRKSKINKCGKLMKNKRGLCKQLKKRDIYSKKQLNLPWKRTNVSILTDSFSFFTANLAFRTNFTEVSVSSPFFLHYILCQRSTIFICSLALFPMPSQTYTNYLALLSTNSIYFVSKREKREEQFCRFTGIGQNIHTSQRAQWALKYMYLRR